MKRISLLVFTLLLSVVLVTAQRMSRKAVNSAAKAFNTFSPNEAVPLNPAGVVARPLLPVLTSEVEPVPMFSSVNVFSVVNPGQNCLTYDPAIGAIVFAFRGNPGELGTGNEICTAVSTDFGTSFTGSVTVPVLDGYNRYPSVAVYNPAGNTNPDAAMKLIASSINDGTTWQGPTYASTHWDDGTLHHQTNGLTHETNTLLSLVAVEGGLAFGVSVDYNLDRNSCIPLVHRGVYNPVYDRFDWDTIALSVPFFMAPTGGQLEFLPSPVVAFSPDGSVGYAMFIGSDSRAQLDDLTGYQPILFKSTDLGLTWQLMERLDLTSIPVLIGGGMLPNGKWERVWPTAATWNQPDPVFKPWFAESDMVVDVNGNLHIMAICQGLVSDHPDSTGFTYEYEKGSIFEFYNIAQGDDWHVRYIDTLETRNVEPGFGGWFAGDNIGWNHRLQASRTADGGAVFCLWTDTDSEFFGEETNLYPDLKGWASSISNGATTFVKDFTNATATYGANFFCCMSPVAHKISVWQYDLITSITDIRTNNDPGLPVYYHYLKNVGFDYYDFHLWGIDDNTSHPLFWINQNPAHDQLHFTTEAAAAATCHVELRDLAGKIVVQEPCQVVAGKSQHQLNIHGLAPGLYLCTLRCGDGHRTQKVIVR